MNQQCGPFTLTQKTYGRGISVLTRRDPDLAEAVSRWGPPPFWTHPPGFAGVVLAILSQQVSLESAHATFTRLENTAGSVDSENFLILDDTTLRQIGFSRQKASYIRELAREINGGHFALQDLESMDDDQARSK